MSATRALAEDYSATATAYESLWGPVILPMAAPVLDALPLAHARAVLDVGTGAGAMLPSLREKSAAARLFAVDRSEGMLRLAARRRDTACSVMDAHALAFADCSFDAALLAFVLFHFPDPAHALAEVRRVLRRDGHVATVTWAIDPGIPANEIWNEELDALGAAPDPRDASVRRHDLVDTEEKLGALVRSAGLRVVRAWTGTFERRWTHDALMELQQRCGTAGRRLATLPPSKRGICTTAVRRRVLEIPAAELVWTPTVLYSVAARV